MSPRRSVIDASLDGSPRPSRTLPRPPARGKRSAPIRWAVVGLGHIAQAAVLPAFRNARRNSRLVALVSGHGEKADKLAARYRVERPGGYRDFETILRDAAVDAVYLALPNDQHAEFVIRAANAGVHVLCEKPLAVDSAECERMIAAARANRVWLMTAYRLHFEEANLRAIEAAVRGRLGETRQVHALFSMTVRDEDNIRLRSRARGGGPVYDLGIYCINAARYLFRAEPEAVAAVARRAGTAAGDPRSADTVSAIVTFPAQRVATFTASFAVAPVSEFRVVGTEGDLRVENAFEYDQPIRHWLTRGGKTRKTTFKRRDQFAPELLYFADCILQDREPEPSGIEGLADVRVVEAIYRSIETGAAVELGAFTKRRRPHLRQELRRPPVGKARVVGAKAPSAR